MRPSALLLLATLAAGAADRVDPSFLHRYVPAVSEQAVDVTTPTCRYKPVFGLGDPESKIAKSVARYGEMTLDPGGASRVLIHPGEEQVYIVLDGAGVVQVGQAFLPVRRHDYLYLPPGVPHGISNPADRPCRVLVMGYRIPAGAKVAPPPKPLMANIDELPKHTMPGHPASTLYKELLGATDSKVHRLAAARVITSLFLMEIAPGGTNHPHHHEREEEIYMVLAGSGDMVAGEGADGVEGRHPARAGDVYFLRLNTTVGFYAASDPGAGPAHVLAVRSRFPFGGR